MASHSEAIQKFDKPPKFLEGFRSSSKKKLRLSGAKPGGVIMPNSMAASGPRPSVTARTPQFHQQRVRLPQLSVDQRRRVSKIKQDPVALSELKDENSSHGLDEGSGFA
jgi:hypothetical protein